MERCGPLHFLFYGLSCWLTVGVRLFPTPMSVAAAVNKLGSALLLWGFPSPGLIMHLMACLIKAEGFRQS